MEGYVCPCIFSSLSFSLSSPSLSLFSLSPVTKPGDFLCACGWLPSRCSPLLLLLPGLPLIKRGSRAGTSFRVLGRSLAHSWQMEEELELIEREEIKGGFGEDRREMLTTNVPSGNSV